MTRPVPAGLAEAGAVKASGVATSAMQTAATPPLPQRRDDVLVTQFSLCRQHGLAPCGHGRLQPSGSGGEEGVVDGADGTDSRDHAVPPGGKAGVTITQIPV